MSTRKNILLVGGGGKAPPADGPVLPETVKATNSTPQDLKKTLQSMINQASERGYAVRIMQLADETRSLEWAEEIKAVLEGGTWDGFIIGNGVRGTPSLTRCFERLVAIGREVAPDAPMGFNTHPMDIIETIERMFAK